MFGETRIRGLPRPGHPDTLDIGTTLCRRLLVLLGAVSELAPPFPLVTPVVVSELAPPVPLVTRVVVSELAPPLGGPHRLFCLEIPVLLFSAPVLLSLAPVSVCGPTRRLPGRLGYRGYYDNSIGHYVRRPNPIRWRRTLPNRRLLRQVSAEWTSLSADYSDYFLRPSGGSIAIGVTPPRPAKSL